MPNEINVNKMIIIKLDKLDKLIEICFRLDKVEAKKAGILISSFIGMVMLGNLR